MDIVSYAAAVKRAKKLIEERFKELPIATRSQAGIVIVGNNLSVTDKGLISVDTADDVAGDNTKPITSAAVYREIGNINELLKTI